jgi:hypothetical protein
MNNLMTFYNHTIKAVKYITKHARKLGTEEFKRQENYEVT